MQDRVSPIKVRKVTQMSVGRDQLLHLIEISIDPLVLALSLWVVAALVEETLAPRHIILSVVVFAITFPGSANLGRSVWSMLKHVALGWLTVSGLLLVFGYLTSYLRYFEEELLVTWWWAAPASQATAHLLLRLGAPKLLEIQGHRRAVIAGLNEQGLELARRLTADPYLHIRVVGFFDDRSSERVNPQAEQTMLGRIMSLPAYVKQNRVDIIYISLPMASQPRILSLLDELRDTTVSIYFVPDIFVTDLIQGRMDAVGGLPVVAVCESPFSGVSGLLKRGSDIVLSLLILALASPLLLAVAASVKLTSPGPVIFRQRRYGLDGREIVVYKFRSMRVTEDGSSIIQAKRGDPRLTRVGAFLRRTSLDELPQFFNVLQGRMSIVGPRPHAVAHNETYRKLIKGYMVRHKVKPGITGWAQVNGYRGETETLEKMKARIDFDLDYLRNWSLRLDLYIIARTVSVVLKGEHAH
jgi:putative colanic acid biosysnthesis UDP-glucose lipid carrier transferase